MGNLIVVCGPQAVGKMVVAESLRDKLHYNLMINHDSIEISARIFGFNTPAQREFNGAFRKEAFAIAVKHNIDLIFTFVCAFNEEEDITYLKHLEDAFTRSGGNFYFVELKTNLETRLKRNESPYRMMRKASKKDVEWSKGDILRCAERYKLNSDEGEYLFENHLKIDNTNLTPDEVAEKVIAHFKLDVKDRDEKEYRYGM